MRVSTRKRSTLRTVIVGWGVIYGIWIFSKEFQFITTPQTTILENKFFDLQKIVVILLNSCSFWPNFDHFLWFCQLPPLIISPKLRFRKICKPPPLIIWPPPPKITVRRVGRVGFPNDRISFQDSQSVSSIRNLVSFLSVISGEKNFVCDKSPREPLFNTLPGRRNWVDDFHFSLSIRINVLDIRSCLINLIIVYLYSIHPLVTDGTYCEKIQKT